MSDTTLAPPATVETPPDTQAQPDNPPPADTAVSDRHQRRCDSCGQVDDHPHHIAYAVVAFEDPNTHDLVQMDRTLSRHFDCCNCATCQVHMRCANGKKGIDLANYVASRPQELLDGLKQLGVNVADATGEVGGNNHNG